MSKSACRLACIRFYRGFFLKKGPGNSFQALFFVELFDKNLSCII